MIRDLNALCELVDLTRTDRKLADLIEATRENIDAEIALKGFSDVSVDGLWFRITRKAKK